MVGSVLPDAPRRLTTHDSRLETHDSPPAPDSPFPAAAAAFSAFASLRARTNSTTTG